MISKQFLRLEVNVTIPTEFEGDESDILAEAWRLAGEEVRLHYPFHANEVQTYDYWWTDSHDDWRAPHREWVVQVEFEVALS